MTSELILRISVAEMPAFLRSSTDLYGRPATIFLDKAGPIPGSLSSSAGVALFRSSFDDRFRFGGSRALLQAGDEQHGRDDGGQRPASKYVLTTSCKRSLKYC